MLNASKSHHLSIDGPPDLHLALSEEAEGKSMQKCVQINDLSINMNSAFTPQLVPSQLPTKLGVAVLYTKIIYMSRIRHPSKLSIPQKAQQQGGWKVLKISLMKRDWKPFNFGPRVHFAFRPKMQKPQITRVPTISVGWINTVVSGYKPWLRSAWQRDNTGSRT